MCTTQTHKGDSGVYVSNFHRSHKGLRVSSDLCVGIKTERQLFKIIQIPSTATACSSTCNEPVHTQMVKCNFSKNDSLLTKINVVFRV